MCLTAWGCNTSRHSASDIRYNTSSDSSAIISQQRFVSSLTNDSLNLQIIEISSPPSDSLNGLTVKIARLSRSIDRMVTACDTTFSSTTKNINHSSQKSETHDTETHTSPWYIGTLFLVISLAAFLMYLFIKK